MVRFEKSRKKLLAFSVCIIAANSFQCATALAEPLGVEDRKAMMDAQIEILHKEAELNHALQQSAGSSAINFPVVISVMTAGDERIARLQLPNGVVGYYREGEMVRPGMVLASIAPKAVMVSVAREKSRKKAAVVPLEFAAGAAPGAVPGAAPSMQPNLGMPGLPFPPALMPSPPVVNMGVPAPVMATPQQQGR